MVPPPLDLDKLGAPAAQTIDTQQQETVTKPTQPTSQTTTQVTNASQVTESVSDIVAKGVHANVYQVELGHDTNVLNRKTQKIETIDKGSRIQIFATTTAFGQFFVCVFNGAPCQILQAEINDGEIRNIVPKKQKT